MGRFDMVCGAGFRRAEGRTLRIGADRVSTLPYAALDPEELTVEVAAGADATLALVHTRPLQATLAIRLEQGASLRLVEVFVGEAFVECSIEQADRSRCDLFVGMVGSANLRLQTDLNGTHAENRLSGLFLLAGSDHALFRLRTNHNVCDCRSDSLIKGVASGEALGEFRGLVYVAQDAQRTDARQQSRNLLLSRSARIDTKPQLEIYADDVKCTHGATVGMMDDDAIFYMRQRGLDLQQARRLQVEGFVNDVASRCPLDALCQALQEAVREKLEQ